MEKLQVTLPHQISHHWKIIQESLCHVHWTPNNLIKTIETICRSSREKSCEQSGNLQFPGFLKFFSDSYYKAGDPSLFWGNFYFSHQKPNSHIKGWFLAHTVPFMVQLILNLPETFSSGLYALNTDHSIACQDCTISRLQSATLLACSFFCSFHSTCAPTKKTVNFDNIYFSFNRDCPQNIAKLCMMMNYFERCRAKMYRESEAIVIRRLCSLHSDRFSESDWENCDLPLSSFKTESCGSINDSGNDVLHVDFANRWIGGGVLSKGAVQEEIMFSKCPELITTLLICSEMKDDEAIVITGADEYSLHKGYGRTLKFIGNAPESDGSVTCVAMDATRFTGDKNPLRQYKNECMLREMNKARVAFNHGYPSFNSAVATGNWGCGAFGGHVQLKSMLQWLAASSCGRPIIYYTFQDENGNGLQEITEFLLQNNLTVGKLYKVVKDFAMQLEPGDNFKNSLFHHLKDTFG